MKKRFSEEQITGFLREAEVGMPVAEVCREHVLSSPLARHSFPAPLLTR